MRGGFDLVIDQALCRLLNHRLDAGAVLPLLHSLTSGHFLRAVAYDGDVGGLHPHLYTLGWLYGTTQSPLISPAAIWMLMTPTMKANLRALTLRSTLPGWDGVHTNRLWPYDCLETSIIEAPPRAEPRPNCDCRSRPGRCTSCMCDEQPRLQVDVLTRCPAAVRVVRWTGVVMGFYTFIGMLCSPRIEELELSECIVLLSVRTSRRPWVDAASPKGLNWGEKEEFANDAYPDDFIGAVLDLPEVIERGYFVDGELEMMQALQTAREAPLTSTLRRYVPLATADSRLMRAMSVLEGRLLPQSPALGTLALRFELEDDIRSSRTARKLRLV